MCCHFSWPFPKPSYFVHHQYIIKQFDGFVTFDEVGNRMTKAEDGTTYQYTYNRFNQLTNIQKGSDAYASYTYDSRGNQSRSLHLPISFGIWRPEIICSLPHIYWKYYIVIPTVGLFVLNLLAHLMVRSARVPIQIKEYDTCFLFVIYSFYLIMTHDIAIVLLCAIMLPISAVFSLR